MATASMSSILRAILTANPTLATDEVVKKAKAQGVTKPDAVIKHNLYNLRTELNKQSPKAVPIPAKSAARQTSAPKPVAASKPTPITAQPATPRPTTAPKPKPVAAMKHAANASASTPAKTSSVADLAGVFSNVTMVNDVVAACGGVEPARHVAEAVRVCGSLEAFLQHLDLVAALRTSATTKA